MLRKKRVLVNLFALLFAMGLADLAYAYPGHALNIDQLVNGSDVVAVVNLGEIERTNSIDVDVDGNTVKATSYTATAVLVRSLKGTCPKQFGIRYYTPLEFVGYPGVSSGPQIVFLKADASGYVFADRHFPSLPARESPGDNAPTEPDPQRTVVAELGAILASPTEPLEKKWNVVMLAYAVRGFDSFTPFLRAGLTATTSPDLQYRIQGELVIRNDTQAVSAVSALLLGGGLSDKQKDVFLSIIANQVTNPLALPAILRLSRSDDVSIRRSAAESLWHISDSSATPDLVRLLGDQDPKIQFYSVRALSAIVGQPEWGPSPAEFEEHESQYVAHWLDWAKARKP